MTHADLLPKRSAGRTYACAACVERLGIKARESRAARDGGSKNPTVTIRSECPVCGGPHPRAEHVEASHSRPLVEQPDEAEGFPTRG